MNLRQHTRTGIALAAAYAVALQAVLLAFGVPSAGGIAAVPMCSAAAGHSAPAGPGRGKSQGQGQDCLEACLTGCCSGAPICPAPPEAAIYAPVSAQMLAPAPAIVAFPVAPVGTAHRSRAPPVA
jgi:hypothetical protein